MLESILGFLMLVNANFVEVIDYVVPATPLVVTLCYAAVILFFSSILHNLRKNRISVRDVKFENRTLWSEVQSSTKSALERIEKRNHEIKMLKTQIADLHEFTEEVDVLITQLSYSDSKDDEDFCAKYEKMKETSKSVLKGRIHIE